MTHEDIAAAYEALPMWDDNAIPAYTALAREIDEQYAALESSGLAIEFTEVNPYSSSREMFNDIDAGRLKVYSGGETHALFGSVRNCRFRAVHDYFGHYVGRYQFGPKGEERAWRAHSLMFSPLAQAALTTETRGQNHWVNYGPYSHLPVTERPYAAQKIALLPERMWTDEVDE